ncbi:MAG: PrsW family intramembrane metalloprotease [Polyangiaceae bacterium]|nr:PrsW family intramembrane metalloprotease [Polyangiaceae bacterium]
MANPPFGGGAGGPPHGYRPAPQQGPQPGQPQGYGQPAPGAYGPQQPAPGAYGPQQPAPGAYGPQQPAPGAYGPQQPAPGAYGPQQPAPQGYQQGPQRPHYAQPQQAPAYGGAAQAPAPAQFGQPHPFGGGAAATHAHYAALFARQVQGGADTSALRRERVRFFVGLTLLLIGIGFGLYLNVVHLVAPALGQMRRFGQESTFYIAAVVAYLPVALYLLVPRLLDRFDPEPWWALLGIFLWGACFATGVSLVANGWMGEQFAGLFHNPQLKEVLGEQLTAAVSAPVFEELTKGLGILGMVIFLRREFDGVVDGVIYAIFVAIGFAATENVIYYLRGAVGAFGDKGMGDIFYQRGILTPWLHPLFTSMTGVGFGYAREHGARWAKVVFPLAGYGVAVLLHAWWNGMPFFAALLSNPRSQAEFAEVAQSTQALNLVVGILMVLAFIALLLVLVWRKGKNIRSCLRDEVAIGTISQQELDLICSPFGRLQSSFSWRGAAGRRFIQAGSRLGLAKWHTLRALRGQKRTVSMEFVVPLRQELVKQRREMLARAPAGAH